MSTNSKVIQGILSYRNRLWSLCCRVNQKYQYDYFSKSNTLQNKNLLYFIFKRIMIMKGFPRWHSGKNPPAMQEMQVWSLGPGDPRVGNCNPLQYSCLEDSMDREAWQGTVHGVTESDTTEHTAQQHTEMIMTLFCAKYKYSLKIS